MNVLHLLNLERQRFWPNTTFRTIACLYVGAFTVVLYLAYKIGTNINIDPSGTPFNPAADLFTYPQNWKLAAWIGSWLNVSLLGFLGVFMTTLEFSHKTLRQSIIFGLSRAEAATAKLSSSVFLALSATLLYVLLGLTSAVLSKAGFSLPPFLPTLFFFVQALAYLLLGTIIALFIRQTALATLAYLGYVLFLESVFYWFFYFVVAKNRVLFFLPDHVFEKLTPLPVPESISQMVEFTQSLLPLSPLETGLAALAYLTLFSALLYRKISRADL
jgi:ABC-2 type transport system permease protein